MCELAGTPVFAADPRFDTPTLRARRQSELKDLLEPVFVRGPVAHWLSTFGPAGVPCAPNNGYAEALADPQTVHLGLVQPMTLPNGHLTRTMTCPVRLDGRTVRLNTQPPALGEDNEAVKAWLGQRKSGSR